MPAEGERNRQWLLEPLGANEIRVHVDLGDGVRLSDEARAALDRFLDEIQSAEVEAYARFPTCPELKECGTFHCAPLGKCTQLINWPCLADIRCTVEKLA